MNEAEFDAIFSGGSPLKKFFDVVINANRNVCEHEMDKLFARFAALEMLVEQNGVDEKTIKAFIYENKQEIESLRDSLYMTITADIVTQTE